MNNWGGFAENTLVAYNGPDKSDTKLICKNSLHSQNFFFEHIN